MTIKRILTALAIVVLTSVPALADWRGDFTWTPNTDPAVSGYKIIMDGAEVVDVPDPAAGTASYVIPDITGQSFVLRTLGLGGEYLDSDPIIAVKLPPPTGGFSVEFVYQP